MRTIVGTVFTVLVFLGALQAQQTPQQNLQTCLSGKYSALCRHDLLTPEQRRQAREAELRENLTICLTGKYAALCDHSKLTAAQAEAVAAAERSENLSICRTGRYPALCRHELLSPVERADVRRAEAGENLRVCLDGRYPALCRRNLLTASELVDVVAAESKAKASASAQPPSVGRAPRGACFESTIMSPAPFMGNNGEVFKLADGSFWEVKFEYEYMYEYYPSVVVCPATGRLAIKSKSLNISEVAPAAGPLPTRENDGASPTADVVESQIDGEFSGWEGETIFKLRNGQLWQQSSYAYKYKYSYSPKVLIYKSGAGYKMRVDGVDGEIAVKRLK